MTDRPRRSHPKPLDVLSVSLVKVVADHFAQKGVRFVAVSGTNIKHLENPTETEVWLSKVRFGGDGVGDRVSWFKRVPEHFDTLYGDLPQYSKEYIDAVFAPVPNVNTRRGRVNSDYRSKYVNVTNGYRHTLGQPEVYENSIFIVGSSSAYGFGCEDKHTVSSFLQDQINGSDLVGGRYSVFNLGARGAPKYVDFFKLLNLDVLPGDIVVLQGISKDVVDRLASFEPGGVSLLSPDFSCRDREIFFDPGHTIYKGNAIIARQLFDHLFLDGEHAGQQECGLGRVDLMSGQDREVALQSLERFTGDFTSLHSNLDRFPDLKGFIDGLEPLCGGDGVVGAVVANCNPFTLGHRYLIDHAASRVDRLIVFVVEEDLSRVSFADRYAMVVDGVAGIPNVEVVRSGKYMMSTISYPAYFSKDEAEVTALDASLDMDLFGEYIAKKLNITVRFIGEEPMCRVTRLHNRQMRSILPTYGIRVEEVKRLHGDEGVISASFVRKCLERSELDRIRPIVPESTYKRIVAMI